jgi:hypothetical protein
MSFNCGECDYGRKMADDGLWLSSRAIQQSIYKELKVNVNGLGPPPDIVNFDLRYYSQLTLYFTDNNIADYLEINTFNAVPGKLFTVLITRSNNIATPGVQRRFRFSCRDADMVVHGEPLFDPPEYDHTTDLLPGHTKGIDALLFSVIEFSGSAYMEGIVLHNLQRNIGYP